MSVTLKDIADRVGVRPPTVSRVLNNRPSAVRVSDATRARILEAARELGYHPSAAARALATKRTGFLGFFLADRVAAAWSNAYFSRYVTGVEQRCAERGYGLIICRYAPSDVSTFVFPERIGQRSVDGAILTGFVATHVARQLRDFGVPAICLGQNFEEDALLPSISADVVNGDVAAVLHGLERGHRHVLCYSTAEHGNIMRWNAVRERLQPQIDAGALRLEILASPTGRWDFEAAEPLAAHWLARTPAERPSLIISSDQVLVRLLQFLREHGIHCPADVSLISVDDTQLCEYAGPGLTALDYELERMGARAVDLLAAHLDDNLSLDAIDTSAEFRHRLVCRGSCSTIRRPEVVP